jgi:hypothetical protein
VQGVVQGVTGGSHVCGGTVYPFQRLLQSSVLGTEGAYYLVRLTLGL